VQQLLALVMLGQIANKTDELPIYLPGDVFGIEIDDEHHFSAEAITDSMILVVKRSALMSLANTDGDVARRLWTFTARELRRMQDHVLLLTKTAQERVASFLLDLAKRLAAVEKIEIPMSRQDIADYLGLTIETISRTLTRLETQAAIRAADDAADRAVQPQGSAPPRRLRQASLLISSSWPVVWRLGTPRVNAFVSLPSRF
jgi:CRP-like cAMP-binding protein